MKVYKSESGSQWYFKGADLVRYKSHGEVKLTDPVYISPKDLAGILDKHNLALAGIDSIELTIGTALTEELKGKRMRLEQEGGMFVSLVKEEDFYKLCHSRVIERIYDDKLEKIKTQAKPPQGHAKPILPVSKPAQPEIKLREESDTTKPKSDAYAEAVKAASNPKDKKKKKKRFKWFGRGENN